MTEPTAPDQEFAIVIDELAATGQECRLKMDGTIITGPSRRLARKRKTVGMLGGLGTLAVALVASMGGIAVASDRGKPHHKPYQPPKRDDEGAMSAAEAKRARKAAKLREKGL